MATKRPYHEAQSKADEYEQPTGPADSTGRQVIARGDKSAGAKMLQRLARRTLQEFRRKRYYALT